MANINDVLVNEQIGDKKVRVIGSDGTQKGIMWVKDALQIAYAEDLDLVEVSAKANPPVCKVTDFGKYKYEMLKKEKEARKNQKTFEVKEIRFSPNIDVNDFMTKVTTARKFLSKGDKVKVTIKFRGREIMYTDNAISLLHKFVDELSDIAQVDKEAKLEGKNMSLVLSRQN
jgi:translation initiation factor IF-3